MSLLPSHLCRNFNFIPCTVLNRYAHRKINNTPVGGSYTAVYRFPYVPICSIINKCKKIQLGALFITLPGSYICYLGEACEFQVPCIVTAIGLASTAALFSVGQLFNRLIGYVYISRNQKQVKVAYLDFWGKRKDIICDIENILPLNDKVSYKDFLYKTVCISTSDKPFKINLRKGEILHDSLFKQVFKYDVGDINYSK